MASLKCRHNCMLKAGRFKKIKTNILFSKARMGRSGEALSIKGFADHTKEFGPHVEDSREHIHHGMNKLCLQSLADVETMNLSDETRAVYVRFETEKLI